MSEQMHWRAEKDEWRHPESVGAPSERKTVVLGYFYGLEENIRAFLEECGHYAPRIFRIEFKTITVGSTQDLREAKKRLSEATNEVELLQRTR